VTFFGSRSCRPSGRLLSRRPRAPTWDFSLAFLLVVLASRFLSLGLRPVALDLALAFIFRRAGFFQRNGDRLAAALDLAAFAAAPALQLAMLVFMHDAAGGFSLTWR
jgi:hypothetical protein